MRVGSEEEKPLWFLWMKRAEQKQKDALNLVGEGRYSAIALEYYVAYQSVTALLHYRGGLQPPLFEGLQRESWTHEKTPELVEDALKPLLDIGQRKRMASYMKKLYRFRIYADYVASETVTEVDLNQVRKMSGWIIKTAQQIMFDGR